MESADVSSEAWKVARNVQQGLVVLLFGPGADCPSDACSGYTVPSPRARPTFLTPGIWHMTHPIPPGRHRWRRATAVDRERLHCRVFASANRPASVRSGVVARLRSIRRHGDQSRPVREGGTRTGARDQRPVRRALLAEAARRVHRAARAADTPDSACSWKTSRASVVVSRVYPHTPAEAGGRARRRSHRRGRETVDARLEAAAGDGHAQGQSGNAGEA